MPKRQSRHSAVIGLNVGLQHQVVALKDRIAFLETKLNTWSEAKDDAVRVFTDKKISDLNTVTRSINKVRPGEESVELAQRYVKAVIALNDHGLEAAKQYFDNPPKDKK